MEHETFWTLACSLAHWEFEIFLMIIFDLIIGAFIWPWIKGRLTHHKGDDNKIDRLEKQVKILNEKLGIK